MVDFSSKSVSIIVPTLLRDYDISRLEAVLSCGRISEIIIVSQHIAATSSLETISGISVRREKLEDVGTSRARNWGIERAAGDILVFLDDDVTPNPEYVSLIDKAICELCGDIFITNCNYGPDWARAVHVNIWRVRRFRDALASGSGIAVNRAAINRVGLRFREYLGGGCRIVSGEDNLFTLDGWRLGLKLYRSDFESVKHPVTGSTGWRTDSEYIASLAYNLRYYYGAYGLYVLTRSILRLLLKSRKPRAALQLAHYFAFPKFKRAVIEGRA